MLTMLSSTQKTKSKRLAFFGSETEKTWCIVCDPQLIQIASSYIL